MPSRTPRLDGSARWPRCLECGRKHEPGSDCPTVGVWTVRGDHARQPGVVWLKRPMPPDQWPSEQRAPRDNTFRWWIRSSCGHAARQWAFYEERYADEYELVFRENPCHWTRCHDRKRR